VGRGRERVGRLTGREAVVAATAAVYVGERRTGCAVLVDRRHLVTAEHALCVPGEAPGTYRIADTVEVDFPARPGAGNDPRLRATRLPLTVQGRDVAVLDLGEDAPALPEPVPMWPAQRLPQTVDVFGYPRDESATRGVWRTFTFPRKWQASHQRCRGSTWEVRS